MLVRFVILALTSAGHFGLAVFALRQANRSRLALPIGMLTLDMSAWTFCTMMYERTGNRSWDWIDESLSVLAIAFAFNVVVTFTGQRRKLAWPLRVTGVAAVALAASTLSALAIPAMSRWPASSSWAIASALFALAVTSTEILVLVRHYRRSVSPHERSRTWVLLLGVSINTLTALGQLGPAFGLPALPLAHVGLLAGTAIAAVVAFQIRDDDATRPSALSFVGALAFGMFVVSAYLVIHRWSGQSTTFLVFGTASVTVAVIGIVRHYASERAIQRQRKERFAIVGRFASQMTHDLKNPLAALKGGVQFLQGERAAGRSIDPQDEIIGLLAGQADRVQRVIEQYERLARVEPIFARRSLNDVVRRVCDLQKLSASDGPRVVTDLEAGLPDVSIDADLISGVLDNLLRNAIEATPASGTVTVRTAVADARDIPCAVSLTVEDTGSGMDARTLEHVFEEYFTTKTTGSGLGLVFVRRVAEAHDGHVDLDSVVGKGTQVKLTLPCYANSTM